MGQHRLNHGVEQEGGAAPPRQALSEAAALEVTVPELGPDPERLEELQRLARHYRLRRFGTFTKSVLPLVLVGEAAVAALISTLGPVMGSHLTAMVAMAAWVGVLIPATYVGLARAGGRYVRQVRRLATGQGVQAIPPLLRLLQHDLRPGRNQWMPLRDAVRDLLTELLPHLRSSDAVLLDEPARHTLNEMLGRAVRYFTWPGMKVFGWRRRRLFEPAFIVAVLRALEQVGDGTAIPYVEALARLEPNSPVKREVREAAARCLPLLRVSSHKVEDARTLVRPAGPAPDEGLLRPVDGTPPADPDGMLRPAAADPAPPDDA